MTVSGVYVGEVGHRRLKPKTHTLRYRIFNLYLDLDEAPGLSRRSRLFGFNRAALLAFHERDHGDGSNRPLKAQIAARVADAGFETGGAIRVLALPRVLGYAFNPITLFFCHGPDGALNAIVHQVNNTFGNLPSKKFLASLRRHARANTTHIIAERATSKQPNSATMSSATRLSKSP